MRRRTLKSVKGSRKLFATCNCSKEEPFSRKYMSFEILALWNNLIWRKKTYSLFPHHMFWFKILQDSCHNICLVILVLSCRLCLFENLFVFWSWCQLVQPSQQQGKVCTLCNFNFSYSLLLYVPNNNLKSTYYLPLWFIGGYLKIVIEVW